MYAEPVQTGIGLLMILTSIPIYLVFVAWKNKPKWFQNGMSECHFFDAITKSFQMLLFFPLIQSISNEFVFINFIFKLHKKTRSLF